MTDTTELIEELLHNGVRDKVYPGAVWAIGDADSTRASGTVGVLDPAEPAQSMRLDTVFDVASLTKILAVWSSIGALVEDGGLHLDKPLGTFWPEVEGHPLGQATAHQLLTHTAGLPLRANLRNLYGTDPQGIRDGVLQEALHRPSGEAVEYTDRAALILGYLAEYLSGQPLDKLAQTRIWQPLGMTGTRFGPLPADLAARCAPTELDQDTGVDRVVLGQLAQGSREVADLAGVDDGHGQAGVQQRAGQRTLQAAGGLDDDRRRSGVDQGGQEPGDAGRRVVERPDLARRLVGAGQVQLVLGDVNADEQRRRRRRRRRRRG